MSRLAMYSQKMQASTPHFRLASEPTPHTLHCYQRKFLILALVTANFTGHKMPAGRAFIDALRLTLIACDDYGMSFTILKYYFIFA
jgi:hypothetical protein